MLGLGWTEMLVVGIVALIVIGPKDLPMMMQRIGKFAGQIRRMGNEFQREINKTTGLDEVRNLRQSITEPLRKSTEEIRREFNQMTPSGPKPSGLIKPDDPAKESVADEIRAAAGMPPETTGDAAPAKKGPVKAARVKKAKPVPESTVAKSDLAPVEAAPPKPAKKKPATRKAAPAKAAGDKAAVKAEPAIATEKKARAKASAAKKPAARKPAAKRKPVKKTNESGEA